MPQLQTERLQLIPYTLPLIQATLAGRDQLEKQLSAHVSANWPQEDFGGILDWFAGLALQTPELSNWTCLILHTADNKVIGEMGFKSPGPDETGTVETGYSIVPEYQGKGYATEAARALIDWALKQPSVTRVTAECLEGNLGSIRVLEKTGLTRLAPEDNMLKWEIRP